MGKDNVSDLSGVITVFEARNRLGYVLPPIDVQYDEKGSGCSWFINGGGSRIYLTRVGGVLDTSAENQIADSHFMVNRIADALMISGAGLFDFVPRGRTYLRGEIKHLSWVCEAGVEAYHAEEIRRIHERFDLDDFGDWLKAISTHTLLRRAVHDARLAMSNPQEAFVFIYRGFEWLTKGLKIPRKTISVAIGVSEKHLGELGRIANDETGVRHASKGGGKLRADPATYGSWIAGLVDGICVARETLEPEFTRPSAKEIAERIKIAVPFRPYL